MIMTARDETHTSLYPHWGYTCVATRWWCDLGTLFPWICLLSLYPSFSSDCVSLVGLIISLQFHSIIRWPRVLQGLLFSLSQSARHSVLFVGLLWCQTKPHNIQETNYILLLHALRNIPLNPSHTHASPFAYRFLTPAFVAQSSNTRNTTVYIIGCWLVQPHHIENVSCVGWIKSQQSFYSPLPAAHQNVLQSRSQSVYSSHLIKFQTRFQKHVMYVYQKKQQGDNKKHFFYPPIPFPRNIKLREETLF